MRNLIRAVMVLAFAAGLSGCMTSGEEARKTAAKAGFTQVEALGVDFFGCGENDKWGQHFLGTNAQGQKVEGVVCCGVLKGCTVRF